jgi:hypothetical protein
MRTSAAMTPTYRSNLPYQATTLDLQLVPASTTTKANRADSDLVALQTTGVGSTGVHVPSPPTTKNNRARERACTTGVLRELTTMSRERACATGVPRNNTTTITNKRENVPVQWECSAKPTSTKSERTSLYYRSAPRLQQTESPVSPPATSIRARERACSTTGVPRNIQQEWVSGSPYRKNNLPESQEWETIRPCGTVHVNSHGGATTSAPNPIRLAGVVENHTTS